LATAAWSAPAAGYATLTPGAHDFGSQLVGTSSAPFNFTLNAKCTEQPTIPGTCIAPEPPFLPMITVPPGFTQTNNCPPAMLQDNPVGSFCTISVRFAPPAIGPYSDFMFAAPGSPFAKLTGIGVGPPAVPAPQSQTPTVTKRKCKKGRKLRKGKCVKKKRR
jgi:hypothetical protein